MKFFYLEDCCAVSNSIGKDVKQAMKKLRIHIETTYGLKVEKVFYRFKCSHEVRMWRVQRRNRRLKFDLSMNSFEFETNKPWKSIGSKSGDFHGFRNDKNEMVNFNQKRRIRSFFLKETFTKIYNFRHDYLPWNLCLTWHRLYCRWISTTSTMTLNARWVTINTFKPVSPTGGPRSAILSGGGGHRWVISSFLIF